MAEIARYKTVFEDPIMLFQGEDWVDKKGRVHPIAEMDADYASSLIGFLRLRSDLLLLAYFKAKTADMFMADGYDDSRYAVECKWGGPSFQWDAMPTFGDPSWLGHTPLVKALRRRLRETWSVEEVLAAAPVRPPDVV